MGDRILWEAEWQRRAPVDPLLLKHIHGDLYLWEAEWQRRAPVDPLLLKHIHGDLYAVLAAWDLTPVEQAVLSGRL